MSLDYAQLAALAAVVREGSFERAARALHVTPSAISQRVKQLEERVGAVLVVRGQPCEPTEPGRQLVRHAERVALLEQEVQGLVAASPRLAARAGIIASPPAVLRLAVNADSLATWFMPALAAFAQAAPQVRIELEVDDQDHTAQALRRGDVLAAVTAAAEPVQGCGSMALGRLRYLATASPPFVRRHFAAGVNAQSLAHAPCIVFNRKDELQARWLRKVTRRTLTPPEHRLPSSQAFVDAALTGLGWGMNPQPLVQAHLAAGRLVELMPGRPVDVPLYWQASRLQAPLLGALTQAVLAAARSQLQ
jgi:LysR family transcriptional regulator, chromosome initiation inhibitor